MLRRSCRGLLVAVALVSAVAGAEEPGTRLAPIAEDAGRRVDPMRPVRLSASERERLYEQAARDAEPLERQAMQLRRLADLVRPTVVHIDATKPLLRPRGGRTTESETGSGVIVQVAGRTVVITNRHVVHRAPLHGIVLRTDDGRELLPVRTRSDASSDVAVLEVDDADLQAARIAAADQVGIGDTVIAVGSPFGLSHSLTLGIVSATGRRALELGDGTAVRFQDFIQTDAAINPGNSGGPLINLRGEVVGLTTAIATDSGVNDGVGFAIPISMVMFVARQLVEHGSVARGYLGVSLDKDFTGLEAHRLGMVRPVGARVEAVTPGAPAEQVGIVADDVVLEFAGKPVQDDDHLMSLVSVTPVDSRVDLVLFRAGERVTLQIVVASRRDFEAP